MCSNCSMTKFCFEVIVERPFSELEKTVLEVQHTCIL